MMTRDMSGRESTESSKETLSSMKQAVKEFGFTGAGGCRRKSPLEHSQQN